MRKQPVRCKVTLAPTLSLPLIGPEPEFMARNVEEYEDRVFKAAEKFTVTRRAIRRGQFVTDEYTAYPDAVIAAWHDPRALVYAVVGVRSVCLVRSRWAHYNELWKERTK